MNDYTKNISQSIFTPGVHKTIKLGKRFSENRQVLKNIIDNSEKKLYESKVEGFSGKVFGPIGEKHFMKFDTRNDQLSLRAKSNFRQSLDKLKINEKTKSVANIGSGIVYSEPLHQRQIPVKSERKSVNLVQKLQKRKKLALVSNEIKNERFKKE